ncbi:MAG: putative DNA binding domain-containing protein [Planctomycetes bacterium]|nr:putative DNA binding domain-containing protein [Planctomycetota bacterium]
MLTFDELWEKLLAGDESVSIEVKRGSELGKSALETVSAFSNEPGQEGGYLIFGIAEDLAATKRNLFERKFSIAGVPDIGKLQSEIVTQCRDGMDPPVTPQFEMAEREGKKLLVTYIPEADAHSKPVFIKSRGVQNGSFRRVGASDIRCTSDDLEEFFEGRKGRSYDQSIVADATLDDIDPKAIAEYRRLRKEIKPDAPELAEDDEGLLLALGAVRRTDGGLKVTVAGLVLFAKAVALRRLCPMHRVDYIQVPGREWVEDPEHRYVAIDYLEPLLLSVSRIVGQVFGDLPKAFSLPEGTLHRKDIPAIPYRVLREAVVNAVMHRNYRVREAVQIIRYANRIEIRSPGFSLVPEDRLGTPGSRTRNEYVAAVLRDLNFAENKGTGIKTMRALMREANLSAPTFASDRARDLFTVTLLAHHLLNEADVAWLGSFKDLGLEGDDAKALIVLRELGFMDNSVYRDINGVDTLTASKGLQRLTKHELLERQGQGSATFYVPGTRFLESLPNKNAIEVTPVLTGDFAVSRGNLSGKEANLSGKDESLSGKEAATPQFRAEVEAFLKQIGQRAKPEIMRQAIVLLCRMEPQRTQDLAKKLKRNVPWLLEKYLQPMIRDGVLGYEYPDDPTHPKQRYVAKQSGKEVAN